MHSPAKTGVTFDAILSIWPTEMAGDGIATWEAFRKSAEQGTTREVVRAAEKYISRYPDDRWGMLRALGAVLLMRGEAAAALAHYDAALGHEAETVGMRVDLLFGRCAAHLQLGNLWSAQADAAAACEVFFSCPDFYVGDANPWGEDGAEYQAGPYPIEPTLDSLLDRPLPLTQSLRRRLSFLRALRSDDTTLTRTLAAALQREDPPRDNFLEELLAD